MRFWLLFRLRQLYRALNATGWPLLALALVVTAGLWLSLIQSLLTLDWKSAAAIGIAAAGLWHVNRRDREKLKQSPLPLHWFLLTDYLLLLLPLGVILGLGGRSDAALALLPALLWSLFPLRAPETRRNPFVLPLHFISPQAYEWLAVLRGGGLMVILGFALFIGIFKHYAFFLLGSALILLALPQGFDHTGPFSFLPHSFLDFRKRWRALARVLHIILLPGYVITLILHREYWYLPLYVFFAAEVFLLLCFSYKVYVWEPDRTRVYNSNISAMGFLFLILPGLIVIPLIQALWYTYKFSQR